jgi:hypothetical protein
LPNGDAALSSIANGGNDKNYIINITADSSIGGSYSGFGSVSGVKVSLRGEGKTLSCSGSGSLLSIGSGQTVILRCLALRSFDSVIIITVFVGGTFIMQSGEILGNASISEHNSGGYGVSVAVAGTFTMTMGKYQIIPSRGCMCTAAPST